MPILISKLVQIYTNLQLFLSRVCLIQGRLTIDRVIYITQMKKKDAKEKDNKQKIDYNELINKNLHDFKLTFDYTGYQYTRLDLSSKSLDVLSPLFKQFKYLEHIDVSNNSIADLTHLASLPNLVTLNAEKNNVKDFKALNIEEGWKTLRSLNLSFNKVSELVPINVPNLLELSLIENKIEKIQTFGGHPKLKKLQLRRNKISSLNGLSNLPELTQLYLAENKIKSLTGLDIPNIRILHLRKNVITGFEQTFPAYEQLTYFNVRENLIEKFQEILKTKDLPNLKEIIYSQNPFIVKYEFYLFDTINTNLRLKRINKVAITKSIKLRAFKHAEDKWKAAEEEKKRLEEEERRKAELQNPPQQ